jgi:hypothetical protein
MNPGSFFSLEKVNGVYEGRNGRDFALDRPRLLVRLWMRERWTLSTRGGAFEAAATQPLTKPPTLATFTVFAASPQGRPEA